MVFSSETSAGRCVEEGAAGSLLAAGCKLKLVAPPSSVPPSFPAQLPTPEQDQHQHQDEGRDEHEHAAGGDTDDDRSLGSLESIDLLREAWRQEEERQGGQGRRGAKEGAASSSSASFHIAGVEDEVSAIFTTQQQGEGEDVSSHTLSMHDSSALSSHAPPQGAGEHRGTLDLLLSIVLYSCDVLLVVS